ncbi:DHA2 family efflux MFS transporter permease subunit [Streptomyces sp. NPDC002740]|uniref:MFS transporter n=1 Tax=Streptomyces asoensis TaxID=249586 RepID=A0A6M4WGQ4_9ACTN|nr:MFS transporter [Streptomyces asoensis]QJS99001.1 MFS transporter [Streptomyces asoensis]QJT06468.1 MFS transporter [Streptomyces asoensis]
MTTVGKESQGGAGSPAGADPRRWLALTVLAAMQFMLVMDITVVNVALPDIQSDLGFSHGGLAWVVNAYVLVAGGFLLLGGRLADMFGRRRMFMVGVLVFGVSSAVCGAATESWMLVASRFVQGLGEALAGPAALGLIPVLFSDRKERMRALGIWGGLSAVAGSVGSVVGGAVTDLVSWRWIFFINVPIAVAALIMVGRVMSEKAVARDGRRLDAVGAVTATTGLAAVVYGLLQAADHPWGSGRVLLPLLGGIALLVFMVVWEARTEDPMIPLRFFGNRTRVTTNVVTVAIFAAFFTYMFLFTLYVQQVHDYSPMKTGLAYIPLTVTALVGAGVSTVLMPRVGVKAVMATAFLGGAVALFVAAAGFAPDASFVSGFMPGLLLFGFCNGLAYPALINGALHEVTGQDSGLASGVQTAMQQVGAALGLATLVPFAFRYAGDHIEDGTLPQVAQTDGYALAFRIGAGVLAAGALFILALLEKVDAEMRDPIAEAAEAATGQAAAEPTATGAAR